MKYDPKFSSPALKLGWKLLNMLKRPNKLFFPRTKNPLLFLTLDPLIPTPHVTPLKVQKLTRAEMDEHQLKGLCYNCDEKYFWGTSVRNKKTLWSFPKMFPMNM
jgi:hypothetical protein